MCKIFKPSDAKEIAREMIESCDTFVVIRCNRESDGTHSTKCVFKNIRLDQMKAIDNEYSRFVQCWSTISGNNS